MKQEKRESTLDRTDYCASTSPPSSINSTADRANSAISRAPDSASSSSEASDEGCGASARRRTRGRRADEERMSDSSWASPDSRSWTSVHMLMWVNVESSDSRKRVR